jgi:hypothetical protein
VIPDYYFFEGGVSMAVQAVELRFNGKLLGRKAAAKLQKKRVTETLKTWNLTEGIVTNRPLIPGEKLLVYLDDRFLGEATLRLVERVRWRLLNLQDARRLGYENQNALRDSLRRCGLNPPLDDCTLFRIRWMWGSND